MYPSGQPQLTANNVISLRELRAHCAACSMRELCLPSGLDTGAMRELDALVSPLRFKKGAPVFRGGDHFKSLYAIRSGSCKTTVSSEGGREQITGYHIMGDIIGFDGIASDQHQCCAIALEDTQLCRLPFDRLEELARQLPALQHCLHRILSREIAREESLILVLGSMHAEERIAAFLLNLSQRYQQRGYSSTKFVLRMTRSEIGSYLGLKLETVSRLLSRLHADGLIKIDKRAVQLIDPKRLKEMLDECG
jgi:CRP/FNR family transcriptional regulator